MNIRRQTKALLAGAAVIAGLALAQTAAQAAPSDCQSGFICFYRDAGYKNLIHSRFVSGERYYTCWDLPGQVWNQTSSWYNNAYVNGVARNWQWYWPGHSETLWTMGPSQGSSWVGNSVNDAMDRYCIWPV